MKVLLISRYPGKGKKHAYTSGIASYTKNLLTFLAKNVEFIVLADKIENRIELYNENNTIYIFRIWNSAFSLIPFVIKQFRKIRNKVDIIHIQYDTFLYGRLFPVAVVPLLSMLKSTKRPITVSYTHLTLPTNREV